MDRGWTGGDKRNGICTQRNVKYIYEIGTGRIYICVEMKASQTALVC